MRETARRLGARRRDLDVLVLALPGLAHLAQLRAQRRELVVRPGPVRRVELRDFGVDGLRERDVRSRVAWRGKALCEILAGQGGKVYPFAMCV